MAGDNPKAFETGASKRIANFASSGESILGCEDCEIVSLETEESGRMTEGSLVHGRRLERVGAGQEMRGGQSESKLPLASMNLSLAVDRFVRTVAT